MSDVEIRNEASSKMRQDLDFHSDRDATLKLIDWFDIERVRAAKVLVAGAGAVGNEVLKNLALLGVGSIYILDFDTIETSNLSRSILYRARDRGRSKAETAARAVAEINPAVNAYWLHGNIESDLGEGMVREMDVVIGCLDNPLARFVLNRLCRRAGRPWVDAGVGSLSGQVRVFDTQGPCYECALSTSDYRELGVGLSCGRVAGEKLALNRVPTTPAIASLVAAVQVQECLKLLDPGRWRGRTLAGRELSFNGAVCEAEVSGLRERSGCFAHLEIPPEDLVPVAGASAGDTAGALLEAMSLLPGLVLTELYLGALPGPGAMGGEVVLGRRCSCGSVLEMCCPLSKLQTGGLACGCGRGVFRWESDLETTHLVTRSSPGRLLGSRLIDLGIPRSGYLAARGREGAMRFLALAGDRVAELFTPASGAEAAA